MTRDPRWVDVRLSPDQIAAVIAAAWTGVYRRDAGDAFDVDDTKAGIARLRRAQIAAERARRVGGVT